jgi:hypothetical protein
MEVRTNGERGVRVRQMKLMNCADQRTVVCGFSAVSYASGYFNTNNLYKKRYELWKSLEKT